LHSLNYETTALRSKSWDEFAVPGAPKMDFIFTVCDNAANEICPIWPGHPASAHWGLPDPAAAEGTEDTRYSAFVDAYRVLFDRIATFLTKSEGTR
jgi:arsenate reductase